jgi:DNA polymerase-3 subunit epsilon
VSLAYQPSFDDLSTPLFEVNFCVLDLETTGVSAANCEITEIGAVKHRGGDLLASFQTLVDPGAVIPPSITILTGITQAMVVDAPAIATALPSFLEFLGDAVIVGHNVRFDISFLNAASERLGYGRLPNQYVDTAALARRLIRPEVRNLRLATLASHFRSPITPDHRALTDARATAHVFHSLLERAGSLGVTSLDDLLQLPRARGSAHYSKMRLTDGLPRSPGVYTFLDRHGSPIYVGKATDLRSRVRQYFYGDTRRAISSMMRELHSIEHQVCPSVLEAEVTELRLIHAHRPRYNRRSRPAKTSHFVKLTNEAYPRLSVVRTIRDDSLLFLGPFRTRKSAELVVSALWDCVPIRRCRGAPGSRTGKCAPAQMGVALCPCDGTLGHVEYSEVVERLIEGVTADPDRLLENLESRMAGMSAARRYEEAGWLRDRHEALARAIERRQSWNALQDVGLWEAAAPDGTSALIDHGRLVATWRSGTTPPLLPAGASTGGSSEVPPSVQVAEEADIVWKWVTAQRPAIVDATGTLSLPRRRPTHLGERLAAA